MTRIFNIRRWCLKLIELSFRLSPSSRFENLSNMFSPTVVLLEYEIGRDIHLEEGV